jgi:hypothetical protein
MVTPDSLGSGEARAGYPETGWLASSARSRPMITVPKDVEFAAAALRPGMQRPLRGTTHRR